MAGGVSNMSKCSQLESGEKHHTFRHNVEQNAYNHFENQRNSHI